MKSNLQRLGLTLLFISTTSLAEARNITGYISASDLGVWAMIQHKSICKTIYESVSSKKVSVKQLKYEELISKLMVKQKTFIYTDPDDPTVGYDSFYNAPGYLISPYSGFVLSDSFFQLIIDKKGHSIRFDKKVISLFNENEMAYLNAFKSQDSVLYVRIPAISHILLKNQVLKIYKNAMEHKCRMYPDDSFKTTLNPIEIENRGTVECVVFKRTDREDPTIGIDSSFLCTFPQSLNMFQNQPVLAFTLNLDTGTYHFSACGSGILMDYFPLSTAVKTIGLVKTNELTFMNKAELKLINLVLISTLDHRLNNNFSDLYAYQKAFFPGFKIHENRLVSDPLH